MGRPPELHRPIADKLSWLGPAPRWFCSMSDLIHKILKAVDSTLVQIEDKEVELKSKILLGLTQSQHRQSIKSMIRAEEPK